MGFSTAIVTDGFPPKPASVLASTPRWEIDELRERLSRTELFTGLMSSAVPGLRGLTRYLDPIKIIRLRFGVADFQCLLAMSESSGWDLVLALRAWPWKGRVFIIFHGQSWWSKRNRFCAALAREMENVHFLCFSASLRTLLMDEYGIQADRIHVTLFGVDCDYFQCDSSESSGEFILSAGTASRDYRTLSQAVENLDVSLRIAADSAWHKERLNIDESDLSTNVHIKTAGTYEGLRQLYKSAAFVVVPLLNVRFACGYAVIAEAMAMGKAVIATRTGCPSDMIIDGVSGLYVPPNDVPALRNAVERLLHDKELACRMGQEARKQVEMTYNIKSYSDRILSCLYS